MSLPWRLGVLRGRCIPVVKDEFFTTEDLRQDLETHGAEVLSPVLHVAYALSTRAGHDTGAA